MATVYLNGEFLPQAEARVSVLDRGWLFADAIYEVIPAFAGRLFRFDDHYQRLQRSLDAVRLANPLSRDGWQAVLQRLIHANGGGHQSLYLQISRGAADHRHHVIPQGLTPTVFAMATPLAQTLSRVEDLRPVMAITCDDIRWKRCDIKATALLANVLLKQQALDAGVQEAILVRDGFAIEGAASNLFAVVDGVLRTAPNGPDILGGITRSVLLEEAGRLGIDCHTVPVTVKELQRAEEIWLTGSISEILPVTQLNGEQVGDGKVGRVCRRLTEAYLAVKQAFMQAAMQENRT